MLEANAIKAAVKRCFIGNNLVGNARFKICLCRIKIAIKRFTLASKLQKMEQLSLQPSAENLRHGL